MPVVKIRRLREDIKPPSYAHPGDAGMDLFAPEPFTLRANGRHLVHMGFATEFPEGYMMEIRDKGGLAALHGIHVLGGIVDTGFRGEWVVTLHNTSDNDYHFEKGEKIAQAILTRIDRVTLEETDELQDHTRGAGHHGSSGRF